MNLYELLEAAEPNLITTWSARITKFSLRNNPTVALIPLGEPGSTILINIENPTPRIYSAVGGYQIDKLITMSINSEDEQLLKLQRYIRTLLKRSDAKEQLLEFALNAFAQFIAAGCDSDKKYRYKLPLPPEDKIVRGLLIVYKENSDRPKAVLKVMTILNRMGYKLPKDVLTAIRKSVKSAPS